VTPVERYVAATRRMLDDGLAHKRLDDTLVAEVSRLYNELTIEERAVADRARIFETWIAERRAISRRRAASFEQRWHGPLETDFKNGLDGELIAPVPPDRWPYGPPDAHETCCKLFRDGLYCDCVASAADDQEFGMGGWPTPTEAGS